jgi:hypothetical protein
MSDNSNKEANLNELEKLYNENKDFLIVNAGLIEKDIDKITKQVIKELNLKHFEIERVEYIYQGIDKDIGFELDYDYYPIGFGFVMNIDNRQVFLSKLFYLPVFPIQFEDKMTENYVFADTNIVDEVYRLFVVLTGIQDKVKFYNPYIMKDMTLNGEPVFDKYYIS